MLIKLQYVLILIALVAGAVNTLCFTLQNKQEVVEFGAIRHFYHPYMQGVMRFLSNSFTIVIALVTGTKLRDNTKEKLNPFVFVVAGLMDVVFSFSYYISLNFIPTSIYQMFRGGTLIITYFFSVIIIKTSLIRHKVIGCLIIVVGLIIVGLANYFLGPASEDKRLVGVGYALIILGVTLNGLHFVYQQYLMRKYGIDPLWMLGVQSFISLAMCGIIIPIMGYIPCPFQDSACVTNSDGEKVIQSIAVFFDEIFQSWVILFGIGLLLITMVIFNGVGLVIVKKMSSLVRAVVEASRTVLVWMAGIVITATLGKDDKNYKWQSLEWRQVLSISSGFILLIFGNLIYYQLATISCFMAPQKAKQSKNQQKDQPLVQKLQEI